MLLNETDLKEAVFYSNITWSMLGKENTQSKDERGLYDRDLCIKKLFDPVNFEVNSVDSVIRDL